MQHFKEGCTLKHKVFWDGKMAMCSCKHFEFWGILCRHILSVFFHKDCSEIPSTYLPSRWHCELKQDKKVVDVPQNDTTSLVKEIPLGSNNIIGDDIGCPLTSNIKGNPKQKQMKGGKELGKLNKTCGLCKRIGHNITTCPEKEDIDSQSYSQKKKKNKKKAEDDSLNPMFSLKF
ncbi:hypothetical protein Q3G72_009571 [Acer saccharum]|nr:hypothetical protein Q3G72_009571 [Acer saccharum]